MRHGTSVHLFGVIAPCGIAKVFGREVSSVEEVVVFSPSDIDFDLEAHLQDPRDGPGRRLRLHQGPRNRSH
jgi:hypothetical protein